MTELQISSEEGMTPTLLGRKRASTIFVGANYLKGLHIYIQGFLCWHLWIHMATSEIRRRYRRTLLGPFWVTLNVAIFIGMMGLVFPILWHTNVKTYLPFFASGFILWSFVATSITEACGTFFDMRGLIKQIPLPYSVYAFTVVTRNVIILCHHLVVYVIIVLIFGVPINFNTVLFVPAMLLLCLTSSWVSILLGLLAVRFRDVKQVVTNFLQIAMFVTPIFWMPAQLGSSWQAKLLVTANPLYHFVALARAPLLGQPPILMNWVAGIGVCILGWVFTMKLLGKYHRHLVFWL